MDIKNKIKRNEVFRKLKAKKEKEKQERKLKRKREAEELGVAPEVEKQHTLETLRENDDTVVQPGDEEVQVDEDQDEFSEYFKSYKVPKIMITTRPVPSSNIYKFVKDFMGIVPNSFYYPRKQYDLKDIQVWARNKKFTHLVVIGEKDRKVNQMLLILLEGGPSALFKISGYVHSGNVHGHGTASDHNPELILNRFTTRLGHRVGRFLGSLFSHNPEFRGRNVVTFHNQRDYIFVRFHRYKFAENGEKARLQEVGARFTLRLRWIMASAFEPEHAEYEWVHNTKSMDTSRRKFAL